MTLIEQKAIALKKYKEARQNVLDDYNARTWKSFCDAMRNCKLLGVRI